MLFTPSSSDSLPLFPAADLSSGCEMNDRLIIQRPPCEAGSFAWSDFAIIETDSFTPSKNSFHCSSSLADRHMEDSSSTASLDTYMSLTSSELRSSTSSETSLNQRRVKFSPVLEVRTHAITLGDHPCCTVLPVELDWGYADTEHVNLELHEMKKAYHGKARKRSYVERKQLLQAFVDEECLQSTLQQQPLLRKAGISSRQLRTLA
ncbi:MAG: hypothetical protein SGBAC_004456 [Bacillariaceae sp.]